LTSRFAAGITKTLGRAAFQEVKRRVEVGLAAWGNSQGGTASERAAWALFNTFYNEVRASSKAVAREILRRMGG
jgi:hypothetical protein